MVQYNHCGVWSLSCVLLFATPWTAAPQAPLSFTIFQSFLRFMSIESVMLFNHILCHPFLLLPSIFPIIRVFSNESTLHPKWPSYWSFSFSISSSNEFFPLGLTDLISLKFKRLSKTQIFWHSAFFMVLLSHPSIQRPLRPVKGLEVLQTP